MKKVLIITYYWPPSGGSSVLRWLKFSKYLREFGWEPIVYTPQNPESQEIDHSLVSDIPDDLQLIKTRIREPYTIYKRLTGRKKNDRLGVALMNDKKGPSLTNKLSLWIRSNFFIPDPRRFWVRPSVKYLCKYLDVHPVDLIVTTGPPHSMHLIGLGVKKKTGIKWVADFRDPWTNIDFYNDLLLTRFADRTHKKLEKKVIDSADLVLTVSSEMTKEYLRMKTDQVLTLTNGYDAKPEEILPSSNQKFTLLHLGSMPKSRNPEILWKALADLVSQNSGFADRLNIELIGRIDHSVLQSIHHNNLQGFVTRKDYVPHEETPRLLADASVLLLCINNTPNAKGILTNKFFEYISIHRPIIAFGPTEGDAADILKETQTGTMFQYSEQEALTSHIIKLFELFLQNRLTINSKNIEKYARKNLTRRLSEIFNGLTE